jgi:hypothetical protein
MRRQIPPVLQFVASRGHKGASPPRRPEGEYSEPGGRRSEVRESPQGRTLVAPARALKS